jgi:hypothetical protein
MSLLATFLLPSPVAFAADLNITCDADICNPQTVPEFFSSADTWYPGKKFSKSIAITNTGKKKFPVTVQASSPQTKGNLDMVIQFTINSSARTPLWDGPLHSLYSYGPIDLSSSLAKGETQTYTFTAYMYESADDQYQGKTTTFNMTIGNYIYEHVTPSPCPAQIPVKPGWFNISQMSNTDVILYWGPVSTPYTGFTISWGTDPNGSNVGTKNIGKTYETLISGLALDKWPYYFKVRTVNECAASDYSSILSVGGASFSAPTLPPSPTPPPGVTTSSPASGEAVLGASTAKSNPADLIPLFVGVSTATIFIYWIYSMLFL